MRNRLAIVFACLVATTASGQDGTVSFSSAVTFETGETWVANGERYRLYGVQSCLRGTTYIAPDGAGDDCGLRSIAAIAALFSTGTVGCQPVGKAKDAATFVVCGAQIDGTTIDVGTALISTGSAFAAEGLSGAAVSQPYAVAEMSAKQQKRGLWAGDFTHPVMVLRRGR